MFPEPCVIRSNRCGNAGCAGVHLARCRCALSFNRGKEVKWGAPPPVFPPGAKFAVIAGDPAATGLVTVRFDMPAELLRSRLIFTRPMST